MTDNRNRTASEIRSVITHHGGNLGAAGSVGWMFKKQGLVVFEKAAVDEEKLTDQAIELGADDIRTEGESLIVVTEPKEFERIREGLKAAGLPAPVHAEVTMVPQNVVHLTGKEAVGGGQARQRAGRQRRRSERVLEHGRRRIRPRERRLTNRAAHRCAYWASIPARSASVTASSSVRGAARARCNYVECGVISASARGMRDRRGWPRSGGGCAS